RAMGPVERVTIVIPTYDDHPDHLDQAVSSALAQTYRDVEVVVVDDGSARPVSLGKGGPTLKVLRQANSGPAAARNLGIAQGSGSVVVCLDADDRLDRHYVAEVVEVLGDPQVTIAHPRVREFGAGRGEWGGDAVL